MTAAAHTTPSLGFNLQRRLKSQMLRAHSQNAEIDMGDGDQATLSTRDQYTTCTIAHVIKGVGIGRIIEKGL